MSVYLDVIPKLNMGAARAVERELMAALGGVSKGIERALGPGIGAVFSGAASSIKRDVRELEAQVQRTADAEMEAARKMSRSSDMVALQRQRATEATEKHGASSSKAMAAQMGLSDAQARHARDQRRYVDAMNESEGATRALASAAADGGGVLAAMGGPVTAAAVAVGGLGLAWAKAADAAAPFQAQLTKLNTAADVSAQKLPAISKMILGLAPQVGLSPTELMNGAYFAAKAGYKNPADMQKVLKAGGQMAAIEGVPLDEAMKAITTQLSDYNMRPDQAATAASQIVAASGAAKVPLSEFTGAMHIVEPVASKMGIGAPQWMAMVSQMTQSGMGADQAGQDVLHLIQKMQAPTAQMRGEWGALGLDPMKIKQEFIKDPFAAMQEMQNAVAAHTDKATGLVNINANYQNAQAKASLNTMMGAMTPEQQAIAQQIESGQLTYKQWRKSRGGQNMADVAKLNQFNELFQKQQGFSQLLASGQGTQQTGQQAIQALTGDQTTGQAFQQLTGEGGAKAKATANTIAGAKPDSKGNVAGSEAALNTYAADKKKLSASFGALETQVGMAALPSVTAAMKGLTTGMEWINAHSSQIGSALKAAFHITGLSAAVDGIKMLARNWGSLEHAAGNVGHALGNVGHAFENIGHAAGNVGHALGNVFRFLSGPQADTKKKWANDLKKGISGIGSEAAKLGKSLGKMGLDAIDTGMTKLGKATGDVVKGIADLVVDVGKAAKAFANFVHSGASKAFDAIKSAVDAVKSGLSDIIGLAGKVGKALSNIHMPSLGGIEHALHIPGHAGGGGIDGPGVKGRDSVLSWLAPGEHVLTADDVDRMGGQTNVYAFRRALHRQYGGAIPRYSGGGAQGGDGASLWGTVADNGPLGTESDPLYTSPTDSVAQEKADKADARVQQLEEQISELKSNAKESERDKLNSELKFAKEDAARAHQALGAPEKGKRGAAGETQFGAPLDDDFGLKDGLPGVAKWLVTWLGDLAVAPIEGSMMRAAGVGAGMSNKFPGGPEGTDTVPAWLTPGEKVIPKGQQQPLHLATGTESVPEPGQGQQVAGQGQKASSGFGISGGAIGTAEGAAAMAADMFAPGSGQAVQMASQLMNRTVGLFGQLAGIGAEGLLSTFIPADSPLSNYTNTLPGRLIAGLAGVRPAQPNNAGQTKPPLEDPKQQQKPQGDTNQQIGHQQNGGVHISGPVTVKNASPKDAAPWEATAATPSGTGLPSGPMRY
ncbi:phage tail tape measure protein [Mycobacterium eburneum]|nr:phage tail tape measure protein [Mycobacterium eburneum]TDH48894.1 phage tail tape measure protein [Mycobacterium eburneum]